MSVEKKQVTPSLCASLEKLEQQNPCYAIAVKIK